MSEFEKVRTKEELEKLDSEEMLQGYLAGKEGVPEPGSGFSRSYWHGWRNGASDFGHRQSDDAQHQLARQIVGRYVGLH